MTTASPRRRKGKPFNPSLGVHDRTVSERDRLRNAQLAAAEVDDPFEEGGKILVMRSTRNDPVADMKARGHLTECEYQTARHWERAYEHAEIGGVPAMDFSKEAVDGGSIREVLTDRQTKAMKELRLARNALGDAGNYLIVQVLGTKMTLMQVCQQRTNGAVGDSVYKYTRRRFHECLGTLAVLFGYAMPTRS